MVDEEIDWWSKYYASTGQTHKCKKYIEKGQDKIEVSSPPLPPKINPPKLSEPGKVRDFMHPLAPPPHPPKKKKKEKKEKQWQIHLYNLKKKIK